jgi:flavodoxin
MKTLVIFDSKYGNTKQVAQVIGETIGGQVLHVDEANPADLKDFDLVVIGSPTHGGFPTEGIHGLIKTPRSFEGIDVAAFDTRTKTTIFGYAAPKIGRNLKRNGGNLLVPPEGFFVQGMEGPLMDGELERAASWAKDIVNEC